MRFFFEIGGYVNAHFFIRDKIITRKRKPGENAVISRKMKKPICQNQRDNKTQKNKNQLFIIFFNPFHGIY
jgi:hypothetical protein